MNPAAYAPVPFFGSDCFILALNGLMRRNGQAPLLGQTVLTLAETPDIAALKNALASLVNRHPLLRAKVRRFFFFPPSWQIQTSPTPLPPFFLWHENPSPSTSPPRVLPADSLPIENPLAFQKKLLSSPLLPRDEPWHFRADLLLLQNGKCSLILTWSHLLLDGKGAELLLHELQNLPPLPPSTPPPTNHKKNTPPLKQKFALLKKMASHFSSLATTGFPSLSRPPKTSGNTKHADFETVLFSEKETAAMKQKSEAMVGPLFHLPFYLAGAFRAIRAAFLLRGLERASLAVSIPSQTRPKKGSSPLFQNRISMFFFRLHEDEMLSFSAAVQSLSQQFAQMTREKLDAAFSLLLDALRWLPPRLSIAFVLFQGKGNFTSFFHSHTGEFLPGTDHFFSAKIENGFHVPAVSSPPGTGIFLSEFRGKTTMTVSWREGDLSASEKEAIIHSLRTDYTLLETQKGQGEK